MDIDVEALRKAAEGATPGPWVRSGSSIETEHDCSPRHDCWPVADSWPGIKPDGSKLDHDTTRANAAFIAAANPAVVLALLDRIDHLESELEKQAKYV